MFKTRSERMRVKESYQRFSEAKAAHRSTVFVALAYVFFQLFLTCWVVLDIWDDMIYLLLLISTALMIVYQVTVLWLFDLDKEIVSLISFAFGSLMLLFYWFKMVPLDSEGFRWLFLFMGIPCVGFGLISITDGIIGGITLMIGSFILLVTLLIKWVDWGMATSAAWIRYVIITILGAFVIVTFATTRERKPRVKYREETHATVAFIKRPAKIIHVGFAAIILPAMAIGSGILFPIPSGLPTWMVDFYDAMTILMIIELVVSLVAVIWVIAKLIA